MSAVGTLAAAECPDCVNGVQPKDGDGGPTRWNCLTCQGTGALVPGLKMECPCRSNARNVVNPPADYDWERFNRMMHEFGEVNCQGRGWVLIPENEQQEALEAYCDANYDDWSVAKVGPDRCPDPYWTAQINGSWVIDDVNRKEALAHAICQAKGVTHE